MNSKFFDIKKEKQDRIINAALKVFAMQGYRHGSTDDIVREAAISKGLLFHYFGSKVGLYGFVYDYSVRFMNLELRSTVSARETDLFAPCRRTAMRRSSPRKRRGTPWGRPTPPSTARSTTHPCPGEWTGRSCGRCWTSPSRD